MNMNEQVLSVIPGATELQRLVIVHRSIDVRSSLQVFPGEDGDRTEDASHRSHAVSLPLTSRPFCEQIQSLRERPIVLRQETFSPAVGWFTQSEMDLTTQQWEMMRTTILPTQSAAAAQAATPRRARNAMPHGVKAAAPRVDSAIASQRRVTSEGELVSFAIQCDEAVPA